MKIGIIIQARMTSTRLPGKILREVKGKPLIQYQLERLNKVKLKDIPIIATTTKQSDDILVEFCKENNIAFFRGSEDDVLSRYYKTAKEFNVDVIVRITADCPLIDPTVVDEVIDTFLKEKKCDYVSNTNIRTYPRGMDTEVFTFKALEQSFYEAKTLSEREHVTPYMYTHPELFKLKAVIAQEDNSSHRWTVDTIEDFELIKLILESFYLYKPDFSLEDCLQLLKKNPEWKRINQGVEQKKI
ncbi:acylneuraminate cytidylyltransferase [Heliorestis acidaminivorans]|uniref:Acylneuraminate cytidylyltransferase n=1 Tax=Heliorestis acidaminivorans TaxID=553427 RepID=A0A6I0ESR3_9FIRM|nr:acylneuraminate cytidylyltransferase [Heliorestis acidaminivorans]